MTTVKNYKKVLVIAGQDPSAGAGILADLKTISSLGCYASVATTALTAQNTTGVYGIHPIPCDFIREQIEKVLDDYSVDSVKIGMVFSKEVILLLSEIISQRDLSQIVLDPVMVSTSGHRLSKQDMAQAMVTSLFPKVTLITPNLEEVRSLLETKSTFKEMSERKKAAKELYHLGAKNILIKGSEEALDLLYQGESDTFDLLEGKKISTPNTHGTGCTLSSAIAAFLAQKKTLKDSIYSAKEYIERCLNAGQFYHLGKGHGPVHHFHSFWS